MSAFDDATELIRHSEAKLPSLGAAYKASLGEKIVSPDLRVEIKSFLENVRSALDFAARGLFEKYGSSSKKGPNIYFPYATATQNRVAFETSGRIESCIPGLTTARPDIRALLLEMQHFGNRGHQWLPEFMDLTNENKHERLTPQIRKETRELRISNGNVSLAVGEDGSVSVGPGAAISVGGAIISGGQTFGVGKPPKVQGGRVEDIIWVSFQFETNHQPVLPFLGTALKGAQSIVRELSAV